MRIQKAKDGSPVVVGAREYRKSHRFCRAKPKKEQLRRKGLLGKIPPSEMRLLTLRQRDALRNFVEAGLDPAKKAECAVNMAGSFTDIAATDLIGGVNAITVNADGEASRSISRAYIGAKPWVRILATGTGTNTNGTPMSGVVILGLPHHAPQANDGAQL